MATPASRAQFKTYCLRKLGFPVIEITVDMTIVDVIKTKLYIMDHCEKI